MNLFYGRAGVEDAPFWLHIFYTAAHTHYTLPTMKLLLILGAVASCNSHVDGEDAAGTGVEGGGEGQGVRQVEVVDHSFLRATSLPEMVRESALHEAAYWGQIERLGEILGSAEGLCLSGRSSRLRSARTRCAAEDDDEAESEDTNDDDKMRLGKKASQEASKPFAPDTATSTSARHIVPLHVAHTPYQ